MHRAPPSAGEAVGFIVWAFRRLKKAKESEDEHPRLRASWRMAPNFPFFPNCQNFLRNDPRPLDWTYLRHVNVGLRHPHHFLQKSLHPSASDNITETAFEVLKVY